MALPFEAVTFDCWNTLLRDPDPSRADAARVEAVRSVAGGGLDTDEAAVLLAGALEEHARRWRAGRQHGIPGIVADLGARLGLDDPGCRALAAGLTAAPAPADLRPADHADAVLPALADRGLRLGLVCDTGVLPGTVVRDYLAHHGLDEHLDVLAFSDEVGVPKPDARIFSHALSGLAADPTRTVHVGDLQATDVAGANAAGMTSVRYAGIVDDQVEPEPADHVIRDLRDLLAVVDAVPSATGAA